jgi:hypothetical protein
LLQQITQSLLALLEQSAATIQLVALVGSQLLTPSILLAVVVGVVKILQTVLLALAVAAVGLTMVLVDLQLPVSQEEPLRLQQRVDIPARVAAVLQQLGQMQPEERQETVVREPHLVCLARL